MTFFVITLIAFITAVALFFINDARKAKDEAEELWLDAMMAYSEQIDLIQELNKYKRPRDPKTGRWV